MKFLSFVAAVLSCFLLTACTQTDEIAVALVRASRISASSSTVNEWEIETEVIRVDEEAEMASVQLKKVIQYSAEAAALLDSANEILAEMEGIQNSIPVYSEPFSVLEEAAAALDQLNAVDAESLLRALSDAQSRLSTVHLETIAAVEKAEFTASNAGSKMVLAQSLAAAAREDLMELEELLLDAEHTSNDIHEALEAIDQQIIETKTQLEELRKVEAELPEAKVIGTYERYNKAENKILSLLNGYRSQKGIGSVSGSSALDECASIRCIEMLDKDVFSHTRPNGTDWSTVLWEQGVSAAAWGEIQYRIRGENAVETQSALAEKAMKAWKKSAAHNEIMKSGTYSKVGIAAYQDGDTWIVNVIFTK